jgi:hypothetical protein
MPMCSVTQVIFVWRSAELLIDHNNSEEHILMLIDLRKHIYFLLTIEREERCGWETRERLLKMLKAPRPPLVDNSWDMSAKIYYGLRGHTSSLAPRKGRWTACIFLMKIHRSEEMCEAKISDLQGLASLRLCNIIENWIGYWYC